MKEQKRYIAIALYEFSCPTPDYDPLFQESWLIVESSSQEAARQKAEALARQNEGSYQNEAGETITIKLRHIVDVSPLLDQEIRDGSELYARHFRNYEGYCAFEPLLGGQPL